MNEALAANVDEKGDEFENFIINIPSQQASQNTSENGLHVTVPVSHLQHKVLSGESTPEASSLLKHGHDAAAADQATPGTSILHSKPAFTSKKKEDREEMPKIANIKTINKNGLEQNQKL